MKAARQILIAAMLALAVLQAGCEPKVYYFSFEDEGDLSNDEGTWGMMNPGPYSFGSYGIVLNGSLVNAPHSYSGDFTVTCRFAVDLGSEETVMVFVLSPGPFLIDSMPDDFAMVSIQPGSDDWTGFMASERGGGDNNVLFNGAVQNLDIHGTNTVKIMKKGNTLSAELNTVSVFSRTLSKYRSRWSCISIYALTPGSSLWVRDFQVEYWGSRTLI